MILQAEQCQIRISPNAKGENVGDKGGIVNGKLFEVS